MKLKEVYKNMDKEKILKIVVECLQIIINNEGSLKTTVNADCAINWNYSEIEEIIEKHLTN
jgi:hypothetical protein